MVALTVQPIKDLLSLNPSKKRVRRPTPPPPPGVPRVPALRISCYLSLPATCECTRLCECVLDGGVCYRQRHRVCDDEDVHFGSAVTDPVGGAMLVPRLL